jgi:hypothetical protein
MEKILCGSGPHKWSLVTQREKREEREERRERKWRRDKRRERRKKLVCVTKTKILGPGPHKCFSLFMSLLVDLGTTYLVMRILRCCSVFISHLEKHKLYIMSIYITLYYKLSIPCIVLARLWNLETMES